MQSHGGAGSVHDLNTTTLKRRRQSVHPADDVIRADAVGMNVGVKVIDRCVERVGGSAAPLTHLDGDEHDDVVPGELAVDGDVDGRTTRHLQRPRAIRRRATRGGWRCTSLRRNVGAIPHSTALRKPCDMHTQDDGKRIGEGRRRSLDEQLEVTTGHPGARRWHASVGTPTNDARPAGRASTTLTTSVSSPW
mmetsp:Transcript_19939/g.61902  ORF Transcript_19939/g.61902 Transcript_19939/m.61902 type:complete len:192 (-) Transcript_19939:1562-2137(-)